MHELLRTTKRQKQVFMRPNESNRNIQSVKFSITSRVFNFHHQTILLIFCDLQQVFVFVFKQKQRRNDLNSLFNQIQSQNH